MTSKECNIGRSVVANSKASNYGIPRGTSGVVDEYVAQVNSYKIRFDDVKSALVSSQALEEYFWFKDEPAVAAPMSKPVMVPCGTCGEQLNPETDVLPSTGELGCWKCGWRA